MIYRCRRLLSRKGQFSAIPGRFNGRRRPKLSARTPHLFYHFTTSAPSFHQRLLMDEMSARPSEDSCQALTGGTLARLGTFGVTMLPLAACPIGDSGRVFRDALDDPEPAVSR